ncbi:hypothetical protein BGZ65_000287, partial [Modicella reniformis]
MSASPKTLINKYAEAAKESPIYYNMAPWELVELESCRSKTMSFKVVEQKFLERLHAKIGGIPRYVLKSPATKIRRIGANVPYEKAVVEDRAEIEAYRRVKEAIEFVKDPSILVNCIANKKETLQFSGRILHRWPNPDHESYHLKWGSPHIQNEIINCLKSQAWGRVLEDLVQGGQEISKGPLFEIYVHHIFRKGGLSFEVKELENGR